MKSGEPSGARRRTLLIGGTAAFSAALGAGFAWWRRSAGAASDPPAAPATKAPTPELWARRFDTPEGGTLAMAGLRGKPLLINFWATWCAPCVREMPEIDRFYREFGTRNWNVLGLAIDGPTPVREFLATKLKISFPIGLAGFEGSDLTKQLGNDRGGLPFSVMFNASGEVIHRKLGETSFDELSGWARSLP